jgi:hypothetical protein
VTDYKQPFKGTGPSPENVGNPADSNPSKRHYMITVGNEQYALRIARGKLDRHGTFHDNWPCVFLIWKGRRWP